MSCLLLAWLYGYASISVHMAHCSIYTDTAIIILLIICTFIVVGWPCVKATLPRRMTKCIQNKFIAVLKSSGVWFWLFS